MNTGFTSVTCGSQGASGSERGTAVVVLLYALSIFSVLALTVLRNSGLETVLRTGEDPDLHVVLYAGGAGSEKVVGRLNLPTTFRLQEGAKDGSVEIHAPGPVGSPMTAEFPEGAAYAVQLAQGLRVCCDIGGTACGSVSWDQTVPEGRVTPAISKPLATTDDKHKLQFGLSTFSVPGNAPLDPEAVVQSAFLLRATRLLRERMPRSPARAPR